MSEHRMTIDYTDDVSDTRTGYCDCGVETAEHASWQGAYDELVSGDHLAGVPDSLIILPEADESKDNWMASVFGGVARMFDPTSNDDLFDRTDLALDEARESR